MLLLCLSNGLVFRGAAVEQKSGGGHLAEVKAESNNKSSARAAVLLQAGLCCAHQQWAVKVHLSVHPVSTPHPGLGGGLERCPHSQEQAKILSCVRFPLGLTTALEIST